MKRMIALLLSAFAVLLVFAGCQNETPNTPAEPDPFVSYGRFDVKEDAFGWDALYEKRDALPPEAVLMVGEGETAEDIFAKLGLFHEKRSDCLYPFEYEWQLSDGRSLVIGFAAEDCPDRDTFLEKLDRYEIFAEDGSAVQTDGRVALTAAQTEAFRRWIAGTKTVRAVLFDGDTPTVLFGE